MRLWSYPSCASASDTAVFTKLLGISLPHLKEQSYFGRDMLQPSFTKVGSAAGLVSCWIFLAEGSLKLQYLVLSSIHDLCLAHGGI